MAKDKRNLMEEVTGQLRKLSGLDVFLDPRPENEQADAVVRLEDGATKWRLAAEAMPNLTRERLALWMVNQRGRTRETILVTDYVHPALADQLRNMHTAFIDTAGNAYIQLPGLYLFVKGNKRPAIERPAPLARAFRPAGLRIIFALLCTPGLENRPYREIAKAAGVALGTVNFVMEDLKTQGHLHETGNRNRRIRLQRELFTEWAAAYPRELRPKLVVGRYTTKDYVWWKDRTPGVEGALWGGEIAAALMTRYLVPATATIYLQDRLNELVVKRGLRKDPQGTVELLKTFWRFDRRGGGPETVHPLLVYADLIATGDPRNLDTARMIDDAELARYLGQD